MVWRLGGLRHERSTYLPSVTAVSEWLRIRIQGQLAAPALFIKTPVSDRFPNIICKILFSLFGLFKSPRRRLLSCVSLNSHLSFEEQIQAFSVFVTTVCRLTDNSPLRAMLGALVLGKPAQGHRRVCVANEGRGYLPKPVLPHGTSISRITVSPQLWGPHSSVIQSVSAEQQ